MFGAMLAHNLDVLFFSITPVVQRRAAAKKISSSQYEIIFLRLRQPVATILAKNRGRPTSMANRSHETKPECNVSF